MIVQNMWRVAFALFLSCHLAGLAAAEETAKTKKASPGDVSYFKQVRPIFQAHCQGCHQPAKSNGEYDMTSFAKLVAGGESGEAAVVPKKTADSYLVSLITPEDGESEMPKGKDPLSKVEIELITSWIAQGAIDDTPASAQVKYDMQHPPVYQIPPVVTSIDFSPDGKLLAVSGFYEVLLHKADGSEIVARLVGMSARIESVRFSPDGKFLAVTGGLPARRGEVQVWDVAKKELVLSHNVTYDTVYGASWSADGKLIAFACTDNSVRAIEAATGKEVLYLGSHNDWPLNTAFSLKGTHVISVGLDRTAKLTEMATQRFIDNITSITPGALKGGISTVERHPEADAIFIGGTDGIPKLYRIFRETKRVIGDDANLIQKFPALQGRIFDVAISADGKKYVAVSSYNKTGQINIYASDVKAKLPAELTKIVSKRSYQRTAEESKKLLEFQTKGVKLVAEARIETGGLYAVAFRPDGKVVATAGFDGRIRLINAENGNIDKIFSSVPISEKSQQKKSDKTEVIARAEITLEKEELHADEKPISLKVFPSNLKIDHRYDTAQFLVTAKLASGNLLDVTRMVKISGGSKLLNVSSRGMLRAKASGKAELTFTLGDKTAKATVEISGFEGEYHPDFIRDVTPIISRMGCNAGTCHGANKGKGSLKLSLRGNDPGFDVLVFTDDLASRRVNLASPANSLMLLKATANVPHEGGKVTQEGEAYYEILNAWVTDGGKLNLDVPGVSSIDIFPKNPVIQRLGGKQQFSVVATYTDGQTRDVTAEASIEAGTIDVAEADPLGLVTASRRGESPVLARYEGSYAATTLTIMGDRTGFVWKKPEAYNFIDELVADKLERTKTLTSGLCNDAEFFRRIYLDLTGLPPTVEEVQQFLTDKQDSKTKRSALIGKLIGSDSYVEFWTNKWADMLQVNRKYLGVEGSKPFRDWIKKEVAENTPYDQFVYKILSASGSNKEFPQASYYKIHRTPLDTMENTTHLFLAVRFSCNKCHDHPFERWTQNNYYETAAYFARFGLKKDEASGKREIGRTAVERGKPLFEVVFDKPDGEVKHDRTGAITAPAFPFETSYEIPKKATRREHIARWVTSKDNRYFAKSYVNRVWAYLTGVGFIEPIDDIRAGNPATNPELLDRLTEEFLAHNLDVRHLIGLICNSRTYQLSIESNKWNDDDKINYSHAMARRLPAEVLYDSLHRVTGSISRIPGVAPGTRAAELPDAGVKLPSGFLTQFGRPARESPCECERSSGMQLGPVMSLVSGATVANAIGDPKNQLTQLVAKEKDDKKLVNQLFLRILNRPATPEEIAVSQDLINSIPAEHQRLVAELSSYEKSLAPTILEQEKKRLDAVAQAITGLQAYEKEIAPREAKLNKEQAARTAKLTAVLNAYQKTLAAKLIAWEAGAGKGTEWIPLDPKELSSTSATTLVKQKDNSILAKSSNGIGDYKIVAETDLKGIKAVRLEVLTDKSLPKQGPGRAPDGNFVLTEFEVTAAQKTDVSKAAKVALENAQADFSQNSYAVATAIDGKLAPSGNGWAVAPQMGKNHTASFDFKELVGHDGGTVLTFVLKQHFNSGKHSLGKFRLSVTNSAGPVLLNGPPKEIVAIIAVPADKRNAQQKTKLMEYFKSVDSDLKRHQQAVAISKKPRPVDPKLKQLRDQQAAAKKPLPVDPKLAQLRGDVVTSQQQLQKQRLTGAQDIAWALVNSPSFLFNR